MEFIFQYPIWFIGFCLLLGFVYAFVLYFKNNAFSDETPSFKYVKMLMAFLRFLSVSLLSFLLLSPLLKSRFIDKIQPSVVMVHDNSSSINLSFDKLDSATYLNSFNDMYTSFSEKYILDFYSFSDRIYKTDTLSFNAKRTNISNTLEELNGNYFNRNVGAVIIATDGIYNEGINPVYTDFNFPIYAIALGDTSDQKDLKLSNVNANKIAYLGDELKVDIDIESYNLEGESYKILVYKKGTLIESKTLKINKPYTEQSTSVAIKASTVGIQKYSVRLSQLNNEISYENNSTDFYIDVIDSRQKILLLANAPHPDVSALKQTIELNKNLDLDIQFFNSFSANLDEYNLVILHQLPSIKNSATNILSRIQKEKIPFFIITGSNTNFNLLNNNQSIVNLKPSGNNLNDALAFYNENFNSFSISESTVLSLKRFPPISVPFGDYKNSATTKTLLFQKIGTVETDYPILSFNENFGVKSGIFIGEGLWKWRLNDYLENKNHDAFSEVFQKSINYLAIKSDKRKFRVSNTKNVFFETEPVILEAELYNESYELVNDPEITLILKNETGDDFPLNFSRTNNAYLLKTNNLQIGDYTYTASTTYANKKHSASGAFSIKALQIEAIQTKANHKVLFQLAKKTGGKVFFPHQLDQLKELILNKEDIKPTLFESFKTQSIINLKWIFFLILSLLSVEWFSRKFYGGY